MSSLGQRQSNGRGAFVLVYSLGILSAVFLALTCFLSPGVVSLAYGSKYLGLVYRPGGRSALEQAREGAG